jgi:hypothetical protein
VARPPVATERLTRLEDGHIAYGLKHRWRDGTTHFVFSPNELVEKLVALVPWPRSNLVRYHGCLAPGAKIRAQVVRDRQNDRGSEETIRTNPAASSGQCAELSSPGVDRPRRLAWAELMARVFERDVLECPACGGRLRWIATQNEPRAIRRILTSLGLPIRAPPLAAARLPPDLPAT